MKLLLTPTEYFVYINLTNLIAILGGLLLWGTCFFFGIIARRYELVLRRKTNWQFLMMAPTGILGYVLVQAYAFLSQIKMTPVQSWVGYALFFISGFLSLMGALRFHRALAIDRRKKGGVRDERIGSS